MIKYSTLRWIYLLSLCLWSWGWAQEEGRKRGKITKKPVETPQANVVVRGVIKDEATREPLPGAQVVVKGTVIGGITDKEGRFQLTVQHASYPITLEVSYVGYERLSVTVQNDSPVEIKLRESGITLNEIVISTSRVPEKIAESPVTVTRMGPKEIALMGSVNPVQKMLYNKNVSVTYQSLSFPTVTIRGFGGPDNPRIVQRVDGIDLALPFFGFPIGLLGLPPEIDIDAIEITSGPASVMYGPNAFNGMIDIYSRSPRYYPGFSTSLKLGVNHIASDTSPQPYLNFMARYAKTLFSERLSFKVSMEILKATDWLAVDYRDISSYNGADGIYAIPGPQNPGYNGLNVYGDEIRMGPVNARSLGIGRDSQNVYISRTGYRDRDIIDPRIFLQKYLANLEYHLSEKVSLSWHSFLTMGDAAYLTYTRIGLRNLMFHQHKLELKSPALLLRVYGSWEDAGKSYDAITTSYFLNEWAKPSNVWFQAYGVGYLMFDESHEKARIFADTATVIPFISGTYRPRLIPNTPEFKRVFEEITSNPVKRKMGSGFFDRSSFYHTELQYDFSKYTRSVAEVVVGGNIRWYRLYTRGTLFSDFDGPLGVYEYGIFGQASRYLWDRRLRLVGAIRYDKSRYIVKGRVTPRAALLWASGANKQHTLRLSYQSGFRIPTAYEQFLALITDYNRYTLGGSSKTLSYFHLDRLAFDPGSVDAYIRAVQNISDGDSAALAQAAQQHLRPYSIAPLRSEYVQNIEIGTRLLLFKGLYIDIDIARAYYTDFVTTKKVVGSPLSYREDSLYPVISESIDPKTHQGLINLKNKKIFYYYIYTNASQKVHADYASIGIEYAITPKITWTSSYSYAFLALRPGEEEGIPLFSVPKHRVSNSLYFTQFGRWSGGINHYWSDTYLSTGIKQDMVPATHWIDAQISYAFPRQGIQLRLGAQNLLNFRYVQLPGGPQVGGIYYFQISYYPPLQRQLLGASSALLEGK